MTRSAIVVRLSSLGDVAQALPIAAWLLREGWRTGWVVEQRCAALLALVSGPLEVLTWRRGVRGVRRLRGAGSGWELALDVQGNWKSGIVAAALGTGRIVGMAREDLRERGNLVFTTERAGAASGPHAVDRSLAVLGAAARRDVRRADLPAPPWLHARDGDVAALRAEMRELGLDPEARLVAVVVGPERDPRSWPHAAALVRSLPGRAFLLAGPAETADLPDLPLLRQGPCALASLAAAGRLLAENGGVAVGHDGGAMHVLRAAGARTVFLFGPQDPARTGPLSGTVLVTREALPCRPCVARECAHEEGPVCMSQIGIDRVLAALDERTLT